MEHVGTFLAPHTPLRTKCLEAHRALSRRVWWCAVLPNWHNRARKNVPEDVDRFVLDVAAFTINGRVCLPSKACKKVAAVDAQWSSGAAAKDRAARPIHTPRQKNFENNTAIFIGSYFNTGDRWRHHCKRRRDDVHSLLSPVLSVCGDARFLVGSPSRMPAAGADLCDAIDARCAPGCPSRVDCAFRREPKCCSR